MKSNFEKYLGHLWFFLLPILVSIIPLSQIGVTITLISAVFLVLLQSSTILESWKMRSIAVRNASLGTATGFMIVGGLHSIEIIPLIIWFLLFSSLLLKTIKRNKDRQGDIWSRLHIQILFIAIFTLTLLGVYFHFGRLTIWLMITAFLLTMFAKSKLPNSDFSWELKNRFLILVPIIGIISTIYQFRNEELLFGLNLKEIAIGFIAFIAVIAAILTSVYFILLFSHKRKMKNSLLKEEARKNERMKEAEKNRLLLAEKAENKRMKMEGIKQRVVDKEEFDFSQLVTISNLKKQIVWGNDLNMLFDVLREIMSQSFNDDELLAAKEVIDSLDEYVEEIKDVSDQTYTGEEDLKDIMKSISSIIPMPR